MIQVAATQREVRQLMPRRASARDREEFILAVDDEREHAIRIEV
jgi:hypothetical protein